MAIKKAYQKTPEKKDLQRLAEKDDNLAVESKVVVTKVKPAPKEHPTKKAAVVKPAADRAAYSAPAPKFIIKQAGHS